MAKNMNNTTRLENPQIERQQQRENAKPCRIEPVLSEQGYESITEATVRYITSTRFIYLIKPVLIKPVK